jgi:hypothetical protein
LWKTLSCNCVSLLVIYMIKYMTKRHSHISRCGPYVIPNCYQQNSLIDLIKGWNYVYD